MRVLPVAALAIVLGSIGTSAALAQSGFPSVGDRWTYEIRDADHPRKVYRAVVEVQDAAPEVIGDVFTPDDGPQVRQTHRKGAYLRELAPGVADFSPYLGAFQELRGGERWETVDYKRLWDCGIGLVLCDPTARVVGKEKVTVPAGTFDAWLVVVALNPRMGGSASGEGELRYWLAEATRRIVKYQSRVKLEIGGHYSWLQPDIDMELVSYRPAGARK